MHDQIYDNICQVIGKTPVVRLNRIPKSDWAEILVKLESFNPGGSVKDRIGLSMIEAAEREGKLKPGGTIVTLKEYACAMEGIEHAGLDWIGNVRVPPPTRPGGPNAPVNPEPGRVFLGGIRFSRDAAHRRGRSGHPGR